MDTMTTLKKWEDEYFTLVKKVEAPVLRYAGEFADRVAEYVPNRPDFMKDMPKFNEMMEFALKLRSRVVTEQTKFVHSMMKAVDPMVVKFETMPKPAEKAHVAKMAPRKTAAKAA